MNTLVTPLPAVAAGAPRTGWLARIAAALWRALEAAGQRRGRRELLELAARYESNQPSFAAELRAAARHDA